MSETPPRPYNTQACSMPSTGEELMKFLRPEVFRALGEETRLEVIARLAWANGPLTVSQITDCCDVHISGVSRHLRQLLSVGLVKATKQGREVLYELESGELARILRGMADALECCGSAPRSENE